MRIDAVDFFYLAMPEIRDVGDGSQDMLLVRVRAGDQVGWGECEASPLTSIASLVTPMSHSACKPVLASVQGETLNDAKDIARISQRVRENSLDLLQAPHTYSGIEIALWDLLGKHLDAPVHALLGQPKAHRKVAYASVLFGDTPQQTYERAKVIAGRGFRAAKFGWGPYGHGMVAADAELVEAARAGLGDESRLFVDAGTVWGEDVEAAAARLPALAAHRVDWLEEPFVTAAFGAYSRLAADGRVAIAGGEGAHDPRSAMNLIDYAGIAYVQVETGRIGGIGPSARVAEYASEHGIRYVNHTFTSQLALAASLHAFAGMADSALAEYPAEPSPLAAALTTERIEPDADGTIGLPDAPGLGLTPTPANVRDYLVDVEIRVGDAVLYATPPLEEGGPP